MDQPKSHVQACVQQIVELMTSLSEEDKSEVWKKTLLENLTGMLTVLSALSSTQS